MDYFVRTIDHEAATLLIKTTANEQLTPAEIDSESLSRAYVLKKPGSLDV